MNTYSGEGTKIPLVAAQDQTIGVAFDEDSSLSYNSGAVSVSQYGAVIGTPVSFVGYIKNIKLPYTPSVSSIEVWLFKSQVTKPTKAKAYASFVVPIDMDSTDIDCNIPVAEGDYISLNYDGPFGYSTTLSQNSNYWAMSCILTIKNTWSALEDAQEKSTEDGNAVFELSPIVLWNDFFAADRTIEKVDISQTPYAMTTIDAYQLTGTSIDRTSFYESNVPFTQSGDKLKLMAHYDAEYRETLFFVKILSSDASFSFGTEHYEGATYPEGIGKFTIDFSAKTLYYGSSSTEVGTFELDVTVGKTYIVKIVHKQLVSNVEITEYLNDSNTCTIETSYEIKGCPFIEWVSGTFNLLGLKIIGYGNHPDYYITGDSILMNKAAAESHRWANRFKALVPNTVVSGRGTSTYKDLLWRVVSEIQHFKPHCIIDQCCHNGFTEAYLDFMIDWCKENNIKYIHTMPTRYSADTYTSGSGGANAGHGAWYKYILENCDNVIRFDIATSIDGDLTQGYDFSLFASDGLHPNSSGCDRMYDRLVKELGLDNV